jgi:hypothetical protein
MVDLKDIINNIENIYGSNNSLKLLKDFERVVDELDIYVFDNWIDGELVSGPNESRYFVECTFMWPKKEMPEPKGGMRLIEYGCKVEFGETRLAKVRKIKTPDDIRPGTKKGKIDHEDVWLVRITMPKKLMADVDRGHRNLDSNKIEDVVNQYGVATAAPDASEEAVQDMTNA